MDFLDLPLAGYDRPMLPLDSPRWSELVDAYGASTDIPQLLADAETLPDAVGGETEPYFSLWSALCHQGDTYSASYAAVPHLVRIIEGQPERFRWTLLLMVHAIEVARVQGRGPSIPDDLQQPYRDALARIPAMASTLLVRDLSEVELQVVLAACASAKGFPEIGEVLAELTEETTKRFLEDWRYQ